MNPSTPRTAAPADAIAVAIMGAGTPAAAALAESLVAAAAGASTASYTVTDVNTVGRPMHADIVVCANTQVAAVAVMVWPDADVVVLVPTRDHDTVVLEALEAGATVCVRGTEVGLVAAYVHAVGRRREQIRRGPAGDEQTLGSAS